MPPHDLPHIIPRTDRPDGQQVLLRLFIARSTPNSNRAQHNLNVALERLKERVDGIEIDIVDVFAQPKSALTAGVIVTPTLIGSSAAKRICLMGDMADVDHLHQVLMDLLD